ncbi:MAG: hypothetical protein RIR49_2111 [Actinomycetota bacterium]|jgi:hypothetical protein
MLLVATVLAFGLSACRVEFDLAVAVAEDGSGTVSLRAVADPETVAAAPTIAERIMADDLIAAGWSVDGPTVTEGGQVVVTLTRPFADADQLATILGDIGPPVLEPSAARDLTVDDLGRVVAATNTLRASLGLPDGFASFSDPDLEAALGGAPFADDLAGLEPADVIGFDLSVSLPSADGPQVREWSAPLDGSTVEVEFVTRQGDDAGPTWSGVLSTVLGVILVLWVVVAASFITWVALARRRRRATVASGR